MPKANVQGINLYYEVHGSGYPLILIRGLGSNADHWYCQVPAFSSHYSVVVFDNRGSAVQTFQMRHSRFLKWLRIQFS